jgi:DNA-binding transcriptional MerR regulator
MAPRLSASKSTPVKPPNGALAPDDPERLYTIGELANAHNITTRTIRFYEARGLISPARKGVARSYTRRDRARLTLILRGKNLGFTLEEIQQFLALYDSDPSQMAQAKLVLERVEAHIAELMEKRADLDRTLKDLKDLRNLCIGHLKVSGS